MKKKYDKIYLYTHPNKYSIILYISLIIAIQYIVLIITVSIFGYSYELVEVSRFTLYSFVFICLIGIMLLLKIMWYIFIGSSLNEIKNKNFFQERK